MAFSVIGLANNGVTAETQERHDREKGGILAVFQVQDVQHMEALAFDPIVLGG